jgi:hypothetical protein
LQKKFNSLTVRIINKTGSIASLAARDKYCAYRSNVPCLWFVVKPHGNKAGTQIVLGPDAKERFKNDDEAKVLSRSQRLTYQADNEFNVHTLKKQAGF